MRSFAIKLEKVDDIFKGGRIIANYKQANSGF